MHRTHCVVCKCVWGEGDDAQSHGVCPVCFKQWADDKNKLSCYGEFGAHKDGRCAECFVACLCEKDS